MRSVRDTLIYKMIVDSIYRLIINPLDSAKKLRASRRVLELRGTGNIFDQIFKENLWASSESHSGTGSTLEATSELRGQFRKVLLDFKIVKILDLPCGDFNWMKYVDLDGIDYIGGDIVDDIVRGNKVYESDSIRFMKLDLIQDVLPSVDLILTRDCFVHLSNDLVQKAVENVKGSDVKYILTTTFTDIEINVDIPTGLWRKINLQKPPYCFPAPVLLVPDSSSKAQSQKFLGLWRVQDLR